MKTLGLTTLPADHRIPGQPKNINSVNKLQNTSKLFDATNEEFERIDMQRALSCLKVGDVMLVWSMHVQTLGVHWLMVTGGLVSKPQGMRMQSVHFAAPNMAPMVHQYAVDQDGLVLLQLKNTKQFCEFYQITIQNTTVHIPNN